MGGEVGGRQIKVGVAKWTLSLRKSHCFQAEIADFTARAARVFRKFWRSSGAKGRDFSLDFNSSEKTEGTLPEELDRAEAIPGVAGTNVKVSARPTFRDFRKLSRELLTGQSRHRASRDLRAEEITFCMGMSG